MAKKKPPDQEYEDLLVAPRQMQEGDVVEGRLIAVMPSRFSNIYSFETGDGKVERVWGCTIMDTTILSVHVGRILRIECEGKDETGDRPIWKYQIKVRKDEVPF